MNLKQSALIQTTYIRYQKSLATEIFSNLEHLPWAMLLKSSQLEHENNRFDILVANPVATIETQGETSRIVEALSQENEQSCDDPFTIVSRLIDKYFDTKQLHALSKEVEWPFVGGAIGYFGYDLGRRVESIPTLANDDINAADMAVGIYESALIVDHKLQQAVIIGQNIAHFSNWLAEQCNVPTLESSFFEGLFPERASGESSSVDSSFHLTSSWQSNMTRPEYEQKFNAIQRYLASGDCYQINLAQRHSASYQGSEWQAFKKLDNMNQAPFSAFIRTDSCAILSVSPERFLQLSGTQIETKPIKGTRPRSADAAQDEANALELKNAPKDQAENLMIVDLLRNDIGRVASPGTVRVPKLFAIESFPAVHHLVSTVTGELDKSYTATDLLRACFPGGSITGAPKVRAMEIIEELEPHRRSIYCGSIGYISAHGVMDTSITIRTLIAKDGKIHAWGGGGIVADSQCDSEYQETFDKLGKILPTLA